MVADRLDQPAPPPQPPKPGGDIDLTEESGDHRSKAALGLVDPDVLGWLLVTMRRKAESSAAISIHGFVPTYAYEAFAETMSRIEASLRRDVAR